MKKREADDSPAPRDNSQKPGNDHRGRDQQRMPGRSGGGLRALATLVPKIAASIFRKRGFTEAGILTDWPAIIGPQLAGQCWPEKIIFPGGARSGGILHIRVDGPVATELQHREPQIVERINSYFGYSAVSRLHFLQGPLPPGRPSRRESAPASGAKGGEGLPELLNGVPDANLRAALEGLGRAVAGESAGKSAKPPHKKT